MAILLGNEISRLAKDAEIKLLGSNYVEDNIEACSYDLRIGTVFKKGEIFSHDINSDENSNIEIKPSEIVTILTLEEISLPQDIIATVFAINSLSSIGFLILNPGHIDPGYKGPISICAINLSKSTIRLYYGKKIFTIVFDSLKEKAREYKNTQYPNRETRERTFQRERASNLSNSFFDLIMENEYTPYLKDLIKQGISERINFYLRRFFGILVTISTILGAVWLFLPNSNQVDGPKVDSLNNVIRELRKKIDSISMRSTGDSTSPKTVSDTSQNKLNGR